jgi:hypothetical protein
MSELEERLWKWSVAGALIAVAVALCSGAISQRFEILVDGPHKTVYRLQVRTGDVDVFVLKNNGSGGASLVSAEEYYPY